jgi:hypothetical protein
MKGVDNEHPPQIPTFDRNKYKFPSSKQVKNTEHSDINILQYSEKSEGYMKFKLFITISL